MVSFLFGPEITVTQGVAGLQSAPVIAGLPGGGFIAVWSDPQAADPDIFARIYGADGAAVGAEFRVNAVSEGVQGVPVVIALSDGRVAIGWTSQTAGGTDVLARIVTADGTGQGNDITLASGLSGVQGSLALAARSDGGFVAAWSVGVAFSSDLQASVVAGDGTTLILAFAVGATPSGEQRDPAIVVAADGGFAIAWGNTSTDKDIKLRLFDADGDPRATEVVAHASTINQQAKPGMTLLADGSFLLVWQSVDALQGRIMARHFAADGNPIGVEFDIAASRDLPRYPSVTALADGGYCVVWEEVVGGDFGDVRIARFDAQDAPVGNLQTLHSPSPEDQARPQITPLTDGRIAIVWRDAGDITAQIVDARLQTLTDGALGLNGPHAAPILLVDGDVLTVGTAAVLSVLNQHSVQSDLSAGQTVSLMIDGEITALAGIAGYNAVHLQGMGQSLIAVSSTGVVRAADGMGIRLGAGSNQISNLGLIEGAGLALQGGAGTDHLFNQGRIIGNVHLGAGNDLYDGRGGTVTGWVNGGAGDDTYVLSAPGLIIVEDAANGTDTIRTGITLTLGANLENLTLMGRAGLRGTGNDLANTLTGGGGGDRLAGLAGNDRLAGGGGADRLSGGLGRDTMTGGGGADVFLFETTLTSARQTPDQISDFRRGVDDIDLHTLAGPKLIFRGTAGFVEGAPQLRLVVQGQNTLVQVDVNGDGRADMALLCLGATGLTAGDFLL